MGKEDEDLRARMPKGDLSLFRWALAFIAVVLAAAAVIPVLAGRDASGFGFGQMTVLGVAIIFAALALLFSRLPPVLRASALAMTSLVIAIASVELALRLIGFDFNRSEHKFQALPVYYRQPTLSIGGAFFRRPGPVEWRGRTVSTFLHQMGKDDLGVYVDEPQVTVRYDKDGFRNPHDLSDWEIVVVGDSFTELGHLSYEDLFTTHISNLTGMRVKNLGVSFTGPITHAYYLRHFGVSNSTRHAVLVFFEGNDIEDALDEHRRVRAFHERGERENRDVASKVQTSFLRAAYLQLRDALKSEPSSPQIWFRAAKRDVPVTLAYRPANAGELSPEVRAILDSALAQWGETARSFGLTPWLAYMPCKRRALSDGLVFENEGFAGASTWESNDLPQYIAKRSSAEGVRFIDLTPNLVEASRRGLLTFNPMWDTHLNQRGSRNVADTITDALTRPR